ncbi:MAG: tetratricopeptide repeat protein [Candidatus Omnitrophica bacterium]|nr:tetratricopeptide repeat protein [Candidatus Omnitrophota bacterium]
MSKEQLYKLATVAAAEGQYDAAVDLFQKVIEIDPKFAPAYNALGLINQSFEQGNIDAAIRYFTLATNFAPDYSESWSNLGRAYYSQGRFREAEQAFLKSLQIKPAQAEIEFALGWVYLLGQSRPEKAITYFDKALVVLDNPMIYYGRGLANLMLGDRFKVLDDVTLLRRNKREEQADRLEKMVRENVRLTSTPGMPLITGAPGDEASLFDEQLKDLESKGFKTDAQEGIKVRLRGALPVN